MSAADLNQSQALRLWRSVSFGLVTDGSRDLTQRQMAILLTVYLEPPPHTVRGLAAKLNVTKPVITRALDTMGRMKLLERRRDEQDRRNVIIRRTVAGSQYLDQLANLISDKAKEL
jgi:DNA-binding MarR family transcriptional regulator